MLFSTQNSQSNVGLYTYTPGQLHVSKILHRVSNIDNETFNARHAVTL